MGKNTPRDAAEDASRSGRGTRDRGGREFEPKRLYEWIKHAAEEDANPCDAARDT